MINLALGIIIGILLSSFLIMVDAVFKRRVHSAGIVDKIVTKTSKKGVIIEAPTEEALALQDLIDKSES